ncbi:MAG: hypothetical protein M3Q24_00615 [bacterium]|nr:hypothetical protein [bacterium]
MKVKNTELSVVEVIPIVRGLTRSTLTYFTKEAFEIGNLVNIPLRKGSASGIIVSIKSAQNSRSELRKADFQLKKISKTSKGISISPHFIKAAELTAIYYATSIGSVLGSLLPKLILEEPEIVASTGKISKGQVDIIEPQLIQMEDVDRYREYKSLIRESFAKKNSVLFCVPTHEDGLRIYDFLSKGIEKYVFTTANKSPKEIKKTLYGARIEPHPILFICTYSYLSFYRPDFKTIIFERENSRSYRTLSRPFIHIKVFLEYFAKISSQKLIMGDSVLSLESLWREKQGDYTDLSPLRWRTTWDSESLLIDMKKVSNINSENGGKNFEIFSPELKHLIKNAIEEKNKIFLFGVRKGLSPSTVCGDCGSVLSCLNCSSPVVLHTQVLSKENIYICHSCGSHRSALTRCGNCDSWKLVPLGIGIDRIKEEVSLLYPGVEVFLLDKDNASTPAKARKIVQEFASVRGGILIGTEMAFLYLEKVPYSAIISLDSLFSIPDFGINERIFYLTSKLRELTTRATIIQTRNIGKDILTLANEGNILDFYRQEIVDRESLLYPPFTIFIKVNTTGKEEDIEIKSRELRRLFIEYNPDFIKFKSVAPGLFKLSMIIRIKRIHWPDHLLRDKLLLLTPDFLIKVDPESIL